VTGAHPPARLRDELARRRGEGMRFPAAWPPSVTVALSGIKTGDRRREWRDALAATKESWWCAYDRTPGPGDTLTGELFPPA